MTVPRWLVTEPWQPREDPVADRVSRNPDPQVVVSLLHDRRRRRPGRSGIVHRKSSSSSTSTLAARIRERARQLLSPDPYAGGPSADEYTTTTLYFDTADFAVYSRRGSYRRAKYRIRRYGQSDMVFLERKLRTSDCLTKRRTPVRIEDLPLLTATDGRPDMARQLVSRTDPDAEARRRLPGHVSTNGARRHDRLRSDSPDARSRTFAGCRLITPAFTPLTTARCR